MIYGEKDRFGGLFAYTGMRGAVQKRKLTFTDVRLKNGEIAVVMWRILKSISYNL